MKTSILQIITGLFAACLPFLSCQNDTLRMEKGLRLVAEAGMPELKSSFSGRESEINSIVVAAYRTSDGSLAASSSAAGNSVSIPLAFGAEYEILLLCNADLPGAVPPTLAEARKTDVNISSDIVAEGLYPGGLPMAGDTVLVVPRSRKLISLNVKRMVSRWDFRFIDADRLGMKVDSVKMRSCPLNFQPWAVDAWGKPFSRATKVADGDWSTAADLRRINADLSAEGTNSAPFYVLENLRGDLLPQGSAPWDKSADNEALLEKELCTYAEVSLSFDDTSQYYRLPAYADKAHDLVYRCYLGDDMERNFDVHRNRASSLVMKGTGASVDLSIISGNVSWRTESYVFNDKYAASLSLYPASATLRLGETLSLAAVTSSPGAVGWASSKPAVASVTQQGLVTAKGRGKTEISASQAPWGTYPGMSAVAPVTVKGLDPGLRIYACDPRDSTIHLPGEVVELEPGESRVFHALCSSDAVPVWTIDSGGLICFVGGDSLYEARGSYVRVKNIQTVGMGPGFKDVYVNVSVAGSGDYDAAKRPLMIIIQ